MRFSLLQHRPVEESDLSLICSFAQTAEELFHAYPKAVYPLTVAQLQQAIDQRRGSTVVEREGEVVAFANFYRWREGVCCIGNVLVAPSARGRGVAQYLVEAMIGLARSEYAAGEVQISCFSSNTAGLLLYTKLGFEPFRLEERRAPDAGRLALLHMRLRLDARG